MKRADIKLELTRLQVPIPLDEVTPELERMLQAVRAPKPKRSKHELEHR